jgi:hypothetical protein
LGADFNPNPPSSYVSPSTAPLENFIEVVVIIPDILTLPKTSSFAFGFVVPIPVLPLI